MKKYFILLVIVTLVFLSSSIALGGVYQEQEDREITDTWYSIEVSKPNYTSDFYIPSSSILRFESSLFLNDQTFMKLKFEDNVLVTAGFKASILTPIGVFVGTKYDVGLISGFSTLSLGYRYNLDNNGYLGICFERGTEVDALYVFDCFKIYGEAHFLYKLNPTLKLLSRFKLNNSTVIGFDFDSAKDDYSAGLTWNSSFMIFDGKVDFNSENFYYALSEMFRLGKNSVGIEYKKISTENSGRFYIKAKCSIERNSRLILKMVLSEEPVYNQNPYEPLLLMVYQLNI